MNEPRVDDEALNLESWCFDELDRSTTCDEAVELGPVETAAGPRGHSATRELTVDCFPPECGS